MVAELIKKYVYLIQIVLDSGLDGLTLEQIQDKWERRFSEPYARRTFNNHRLAIEEVFGIEIDCHRNDNTYFIAYGEDVLDRNDSLSWMVNTFTVNNLLALSQERLSGRVEVENIPSGQLHLTSIMSAMTNETELIIAYKKYSGNEAETLHVQPYGLKEYQKRWYLVAYCHERGALRLYSLDRIMSLQSSNVQFKVPASFNMEELFYNSFGPYLPTADSKPVLVRFVTRQKEAKYFYDLPLHRSQKEEKVEDGTVEFSVRVIPNEDFYMELLRFTGKIRVISPSEVVDELEKRKQSNNI